MVARHDREATRVQKRRKKCLELFEFRVTSTVRHVAGQDDVIDLTRLKQVANRGRRGEALGRSVKVKIGYVRNGASWHEGHRAV